MKTIAIIAILACAAPATAFGQEFRMDVRDNAFGARYGTLIDLSEEGQYEVSGNVLVGKADRKTLGVGFHAVDNAYTVETPVYVGLGGRLLWVDSGFESGTVLAFGGADSFYEIALRGEYQVLENAWIYAGYRRSDADFEGASSIPIDSGIHLGMRFTF